MNYILHLNNFFEHIKSDETLSPLHISLYLALFHYWNVNRFDNPFPVYRDDLMQLSKIGSKNTYHKCIRELHQAGYIQYYPAPFKYLPVAISMIRFDTESDKVGYQQLDMFRSKSGTCRASGTSTENDTCHVPDLTVACTKNDTRQVSKVVLLYKHINFKQLNSVCNTPTKKLIKKNVDKNSSSPLHRGGVRGGALNKTTHVPNLRNVPISSPTGGGQEGAGTPSLPEVETFFRQHNYPPPEAQKFYYYNQGKSWMLSEKIPVTDWKAIALKWMLNSQPQKTNNNDRTQYLHTQRNKNYSEPL